MNPRSTLSRGSDHAFTDVSADQQLNTCFDKADKLHTDDCGNSRESKYQVV